jgi:hypothetical protein
MATRFIFPESQCDVLVWFLDPIARKRRRKYGGNKGKCFTEGWLEFKDRNVAKTVAASLNNTIVGLYSATGLCGFK